MKANIWLSLFLLIAASIAVNLSVVNATGETSWRSAGVPVTTADLFDVFMVNSTDGWIVGDSGTILRWNGTAWNNVTSPTKADLRAVYMLNSTDGWAVGLGGVTIHWNGTAWENVTSGVTVNLLDVGATYSPYYYAVGASGTIIKWNGTDWVPETIPTSLGIRGIEMYGGVNPSPPPAFIWYGWAVGDSGTILHYSNSTDSWTETESPTSAQLNDVSVVGANDAWAVGSHWTIIHWNGTDWQNKTCPKTGYGYLTAIDMVNATDGWAMGYNGTILHWNGTTWNEVASPTTETLYSVFMVDANDGWAVGKNGTILHWTGTEWIPEFPITPFIPILIATIMLFVAIKVGVKKRVSPSAS